MVQENFPCTNKVGVKFDSLLYSAGNGVSISLLAIFVYAI